MWLERSVVEFTANNSKISSAQKIAKLKPLVLLMTSIRRRFIRDVDALAAANPHMDSLKRGTWTSKQHDIYECFYKHNKSDAAVWWNYLCKIVRNTSVRPAYRDVEGGSRCR